MPHSPNHSPNTPILYRNIMDGLPSELACDRNQPDLYLHKSPMWQTLSEQYKWMI